MPPDELRKLYVSLVWPLLEYAAQLWHPGLTICQIELLLSVQERAMSITFHTDPYDIALQQEGLPTLAERRDIQCKSIFVVCQNPTHKLNSLFPHQRQIIHGQHSAYKFELPLVKTNRFKDLFINLGLFKKW